MIDALPFLDPAGVESCHRDHLRGAENSFVPYTLLSFLEMPVTDRVAAEHR